MRDSYNPEGYHCNLNGSQCKGGPVSAVSYTHLDVYKRQLIETHIGCFSDYMCEQTIMECERVLENWKGKRAA